MYVSTSHSRVVDVTLARKKYNIAYLALCASSWHKDEVEGKTEMGWRQGAGSVEQCFNALFITVGANVESQIIMSRSLIDHISGRLIGPGDR